MKEKLEWNMSDGRQSVGIYMNDGRWSGQVLVDNTVVACIRNKDSLADMRRELEQEFMRFYSNSMEMIKRALPKEG